MIAGEFTPGFSLRNAFKDVDLALDAAKAQRFDLPITAALEERWREAIAAGHADDDVSVVINASRAAAAAGDGQGAVR